MITLDSMDRVRSSVSATIDQECVRKWCDESQGWRRGAFARVQLRSYAPRPQQRSVRSSTTPRRSATTSALDRLVEAELCCATDRLHIRNGHQSNRDSQQPA